MRAWRAVKWVGVGLLLLALGLGAFVFGKISNVAEEQLDLRCADLARGKLIVAEVDALVTKNSACPVDEMQARTRAADDAGEKWPWDIDIDPRRARPRCVPCWTSGAAPVRPNQGFLASCFPQRPPFG